MLLITRKENEKVKVESDGKILNVTVMGTNNYGEIILGFEADRKDFKISRIEKIAPAKGGHEHHPPGSPNGNYFRG